MIHLEVCSLLFGQKTKLQTALRRRLGVGVRVSLQDLHPLDPIRKKLEDINLSNNATNYSTTAQLPTKKCKSFATPNSWVPFQIRSFKISQHSTISTFARLPSRSTSQDIILNEIASDESIQLCQILVLENFNFYFGNYSFLDEIQLLWTKTNAVSTMAFEMES